jgi:hypothetical protein
VAYDALAASVALIESRRLEPVRRLSRRRRFAAMGVDVLGDAAVSMFARRGVGCVWQDNHVLALRNGRWTLLGGGSSSGEEELLADRPAVLPASSAMWRGAGIGPAPGVLVVEGSGGVRDGGADPRPWPWSGRWISYATVRVTADVAAVRIADRLLPVPWHGRVVVAWGERRPPRVTALDECGRPLGEALLPSRR